MQSKIANVQNRIFREELETRIAEINRILRKDFPRVIQLSQEALVYAEQLGDFYHYAFALASAAWASANINELEDALTLGSEALQLARVHGFLDVEARVVDTLAITFMSMGVYDEAAVLFRHLMELATRLEDQELVFTAYHDYGIHLLTIGEPEKGLEYLEAALREIPPSIANDSTAYLIYANMCQMFAQVGQPDKGIVYGEKSLRIAQAAHDDVAVARACLALAVASIDRGDFAQAELYIHQARKLIDSDVSGQIEFHLNFAESHFLVRSGRVREATVLFEQTYQQAIGTNRLQTAIAQLEILKFLYTELGDNERLLDVYRRLSEDMPRLQQQSGDIRINVLRMVFAADKAAIKAEMNLSKQKNAVMEQLTQDFRTPLKLIQDASDRIGRHGDNLSLDQRKNALQEITTQVSTMRMMLDNVIDLLQPEQYVAASQLSASVTLLEISDAILADLKRYRLDVSRIVTHLPINQEPIHIPTKAFNTSVVHILNNALKFSHYEVDFTLAIDHNRLVARVRDTGIGIPEDELEAVMQPLYRATNNRLRGHGFGLAIVNKQIEAIGGKLCLESELNVGTNVMISVPLEAY